MGEQVNNLPGVPSSQYCSIAFNKAASEAWVSGLAEKVDLV
jgi:hypothetical protein